MKKFGIENENVERHFSPNEKQNSKTANAKSKGTLIIEEKYGTLEYERRLSHPREIVWKAITDPKEISGLMSNYKGVVDGYTGGAINFVNTVSGSHITGDILALDPHRYFEYEWHVSPSQSFYHGEPESVIRWELKQDGDSVTLLTLTHSRLTKPTSLSFAPSWHAYLD